MRADVNACDGTWGRTDTVKESALKVDSGKKIPRRTGDSNLLQRRAGPTLYRLSYIPAEKVNVNKYGPTVGVPLQECVIGNRRVISVFASCPLNKRSSASQRFGGGRKDGFKFAVRVQRRECVVFFQHEFQTLSICCYFVITLIRPFFHFIYPLRDIRVTLTG